jgi:hypothetical protein
MEINCKSKFANSRKKVKKKILNAPNAKKNANNTKKNINRAVPLPTAQALALVPVPAPVLARPPILPRNRARTVLKAIERAEMEPMALTTMIMMMEVNHASACATPSAKKEARKATMETMVKINPLVNKVKTNHQDNKIAKTHLVKINPMARLETMVNLPAKLVNNKLVNNLVKLVKTLLMLVNKLVPLDNKLAKMREPPDNKPVKTQVLPVNKPVKMREPQVNKPVKTQVLQVNKPVKMREPLVNRLVKMPLPPEKQLVKLPRTPL